jgi:hypothetical protein
LQRTWKVKQAKEYRVIEKELSQEQDNKIKLPQQKATHKKYPVVDICGISAAVFRTNLKQEQNTYFTTLLYKIDRILQDYAEQDQPLLDPRDRQDDETEL